MSFRASACHLPITPDKPEGCFLAGFGPDRLATGVLDPIEAGLVYFTDGERELALISVDAIGVTALDVDRIRQRVPSMHPKDILVSATHTHSAPDTLGLWGPTWFGVVPRRSGVDRDWWYPTLDRLGDALESLRRSARPAQVRSTPVDIEADWTRNDREKGGRFDHALAFQFVEVETDAPICTVLNFASHPEALWSDNTLISADFPGHFRRSIRQRVGGEALYISGPLGGMLTPNVDQHANFETRRDYIASLGRHLAERTIEALNEATAEPCPTIEHGWTPLHLPNRNWKLRALNRWGIVDAKAKGRWLETEVHHMRLGALEILTAPGELTPEVGARVLEMMSGPHTGIFGLTIDEFGYILEATQFTDPHYRYERSVSLGPKTAEHLIAAHRGLLS